MTNTANQKLSGNTQAIPPRSAKDYDAERRKHLEKHEGSVPRVYSDPKGIPTIGMGHALITKDENGHYTLRNLAEIDRDLGGTGEPLSVLTKDDIKRLQDVENILNGKMPKKDPARYGTDKAYTAWYDEAEELVKDKSERPGIAQELIPPYKAGEDSKGKNVFSFYLDKNKDKDRIQAMSDEDWQTARDKVWTLVEAEAKLRGWSDEEIASYKNAFKGSWEEMMLASLRFNNVRSPEAIKALLDGDRAKFRTEIEFRSNLKTEDNEKFRAGLARRRRDEADKAAPLPSFTEAEKKRWAALEAEHWAYRKEFADLYGLGTPHVVQEGETLEGLAKKNRCTVDELKELNDLDDLEGKVGKTIFIPTDAYRTEKAARKETAAGLSPEAEKLLAMLGEPLSEPAREILLKSPAQWTEDEVRTVMEGDDYQGANGAAERQEAFDRVTEWFRSVYGDGRVRLDAAGRPLPSLPVRAVPREASPARSPQGDDVYDAARDVALRVARAAESDGLESAIRTLQGGLNRFVPRQRGTPSLLEDGDESIFRSNGLACVVLRQGGPTGAARGAMREHRASGATQRTPAAGRPEGPGFFAAWRRREPRP